MEMMLKQQHPVQMYSFSRKEAFRLQRDGIIRILCLLICFIQIRMQEKIC